jgi:hypothetical protein
MGKALIKKIKRFKNKCPRKKNNGHSFFNLKKEIRKKFS